MGSLMIKTGTLDENVSVTHPFIVDLLDHKAIWGADRYKKLQFTTNLERKYDGDEQILLPLVLVCAIAFLGTKKIVESNFEKL